MGKFKVGDRVRAIEGSAYSVRKGDICTVTETFGDDGIRFKNSRTGSTDGWSSRFFEPTITIEPGKHYRLRNGKVTGRVTIGDIGFEALVDGQVKVFDKAGGAVFGDGEFDIVEAWVPKVGERVRLVKDGKSTTGAVGKAATISSWGGLVVDDGDYLLDIDPPVDYRTVAVKENFTRATIDCFEPLPVATSVAAEAQPAAIKIETGKFYRTRDGRKVGPMRWCTRGNLWATADGFADDHWYTQHNVHFARGYINTRIGLHRPDDLIAIWQDEPTATTASNDNAKPPKFKVGDRVKTDGGYTFDPNLGEIVEIHDDYVDVRVDSDGHGGSDLWAYYEDDLTPTVAPQQSAPPTAGFTVPLVDEEDDDDRLVVSLSLDAGKFHDELDAIIGKLKKIRKLQRQVGLAA